jgi:hypothetical protein
MPGMKRGNVENILFSLKIKMTDMGGAAAILAAFAASVKTGTLIHNLHAILCLGTI